MSDREKESAGELPDDVQRTAAGLGRIDTREQREFVRAQRSLPPSTRKTDGAAGIALGVKPTAPLNFSLSEFGARRAGVNLDEVRAFDCRRVTHPLRVFTADDLRRVTA